MEEKEAEEDGSKLGQWAACAAVCLLLGNARPAQGRAQSSRSWPEKLRLERPAA